MIDKELVNAHRRLPLVGSYAQFAEQSLFGLKLIDVKQFRIQIFHRHQISKLESKTASPSMPSALPLPTTTVSEAP